MKLLKRLSLILIIKPLIHFEKSGGRGDGDEWEGEGGERESRRQE